MMTMYYNISPTDAPSVVKGTLNTRLHCSLRLFPMTSSLPPCAYGPELTIPGGTRRHAVLVFAAASSQLGAEVASICTSARGALE